MKIAHDKGKSGQPKKIHQIANQLAYAKKLVECERLMLKGITRSSELELALDLSNTAVVKMKKEIAQKWIDSSQDQTTEDLRLKRILQFDQIGYLALQAFERSQQNSTEVTTQTTRCQACYGTGIAQEGITVPAKTREAVFERDNGRCVICDSDHNLSIDHIIPRSKGGSHQEFNLRVLCLDCNRIKSNKLNPKDKCDYCGGEGEDEVKPGVFERCSRCGGTGAKPDLPICLVCQGEGHITITTTKVKGQSGDSSFLNVAKAAFVEGSRIEGSYPAATISSGVKRTLIEESVRVGGEIHERVTQITELDLPEDVVVKAMAALDDIQYFERQQVVKKQKQAAIESKKKEEEYHKNRM